MKMILSDEVQWSLLGRVRDAEIPNETLKAVRGDCRVSRLFLDDEQTLILKMWSRPGLSGFVRRISRTAPFLNEALALRVLYDRGVSVPALLGYKQLKRFLPPFTDVLFIEDLGSCEFASEHLKVLMADGREEEARAIVREVLDMTESMVHARIIDRDHSFNNVIVTGGGRVARIDFEISRRRLFPRLHATSYGEMLGRLVGSYAFAMQPKVDLVMEFAQELAERIQPPRRVIVKAEDFVALMLRGQRRRKGRDTRIPSLWTGRPIP